MTCPYISAFFSCSFKDSDRDLNDFFKGLCDSLNIRCTNVSEGYCRVPPAEAKKQISESSVVVGIIVRRDSIGSHWTMPAAVRDELAMSFALKKPTLMIIEEGVVHDGFIDDYGTYIHFDRTHLCEIDFIRKVISSLHRLRMESVELEAKLPDQYALGYYADIFQHLIELTSSDNGPIWRTETTKKLVFTKQYDGAIKNCVWATECPRDNTDKITHSLQISRSSKEFTPEIETIIDVPEQLEVGLKLSPIPQKDDWIELEFCSQSKFFNALAHDQITPRSLKRIGEKEFHCFDGMIPIQPTHKLHIQFRFPSFYKIDPNSISTVVGSYTGSVDYLLDSEIARCKVLRSQFGKSIQYDIHVESPLVRHVYGLAWNLLP